jgi:hypothetical protein
MSDVLIPNRLKGKEGVGATTNALSLPAGTNELGGLYTVIFSILWVTTGTGTHTLFLTSGSTVAAPAVADGLLWKASVVGAGTWKYDFPNGFPVVKLADGLNLEPGQAVFVGDAAVADNVYVSFNYRRWNG